MPLARLTSTGGLNLYVNPLSQDGLVIRSLNVDSFPLGAKKKRAGYSTFLGTADGSAVKDLFSWTKEDGSLFLYRNSGTQLFVSVGGTGAWSATGNGSVAGTAHIGYTSLGNTLVIGDGVGSTRHSTDGTSFTNTTLAPVASRFAQYQRRVYAMGTSSTLFYSTTNDATNWNLSGTSDSSSFTIPGEGRLLNIHKTADRLFASKTSGNQFRWDGYSLVDTATALGPSSPYSFAKVEDYGFWLNRLGIYSSAGDKPQIISNAVERQVYNDNATGIAGTAFDTAPAVVHRYDYLLAAGTVTDDFTNVQVPDAIIKYNYQKNEWGNYRYANFPTALQSYKDTSGVQQLIFGDTTGQVYQTAGTATTDNGNTIESVVEVMFHMGQPENEKEFRWLWAFFNPGCQAKVQVAVTESYVKGEKRWVDLGAANSGMMEWRFPTNMARGRFLFVKIYEASRNARFDFYGLMVDFNFRPRQ